MSVDVCIGEFSAYMYNLIPLPQLTFLYIGISVG